MLELMDEESVEAAKMASRRRRKRLQDQMREAGSSAPFFREKLRDAALVAHDTKPLTLRALVVGEPRAHIEWYRNQALLVPSRQVRMHSSDDGQVFLQISAASWADQV